MKKNMFLFSLIALTICTYSCTKDKEESLSNLSGNVVSYPDFSQLKVGNYWIYQRYIVDSLGNGTPQYVFDSCYVEKDTVINNKTYYKMYETIIDNYYGFSYLRDSLHYIIGCLKYNNIGYIKFSSQDFETIFKSGYQIIPHTDTVCRYETKMANKNISIETPAGTFITSDFMTTYYMYPNYSHGGKIRYKHSRYAENIGKITETLPFFASDPTYIERRLVRYHLN